MRNPEETVRAMASVRDQVLSLVFDHEQEKHGGEPCWLERCNVLGYLAHCLGVKVGQMRLFGQLLFDYDCHCVQDGGCEVHPAPRPGERT